MSINLIVWKWSSEFDSGAKRRKQGLKYPDVTAAFMTGESHPAMAEHDFSDFERDLAGAVGHEEEDGPYILERYTCARVFNLPSSQVTVLVPKIGSLAREHGLTSAQG